jgi:hypothetical protein
VVLDKLIAVVICHILQIVALFNKVNDFVEVSSLALLAIVNQDEITLFFTVFPASL